jgi:hypothetical protein
MIINNPVSIMGQNTRAQDFSTIKHNEDHKAAIIQQNVQKQRDIQEEQRAKQVHDKEDTENEGKRHDAKEKGSNEYAGDGGKGRKKHDGFVLKKGPNNTIIKSFDIKV